MNSFSNQHILITGGTGMLGSHIIASLLQRQHLPKRVTVFSRDEQKQYELAQRFSDSTYPQLEFIIGDIRDYRSIFAACKGVDLMLHTAALKHVPLAEKNGSEYVKTNILGTQNIIDAARERKIKQVIGISTDKAVDPVGLYGSSKLCADRLLINANQRNTDCKFTVIRLGNIFGARGSVVPYFVAAARQGKISITHPDATRFSITPQECVSFIERVTENAEGGEIFVPKMPSYRISDLAKTIAPKADININGLRAGEKLHETLIAETEMAYAEEKQHYYIIRSDTSVTNTSKDRLHAVRSDTNPHMLGLNALRDLLKKERFI